MTSAIVPTSKLVFFAIVVLMVLSTTTTHAALSDVIAAKESALNQLAQAAEALYANRCANRGECKTPSTCTVPSCGNNFPAEKGFECRGDFGVSNTTCGNDCAGMVRSVSQTSIMFPQTTNFTDGEVQSFACTSSRLNSNFVSARDSGATRSWSYIAHTSGAFRMFPGAPQPRDANTCTFFDPRLRPWYIESTGGPRDIVILVDTSSAMGVSEGSSTKLNLAKDVVRTLMNTMTPNDFFSVVAFSSSASIVGGDSTLRQASGVNFNTVRAVLDGLQVDASTTTNMTGAMRTAFSLLTQTTSSSGCTKVIVMLSAGAPASAMTAFTDAISAGQTTLSVSTGRRANIFAYSLSDDSNNVAFGQSVACANDGAWSRVRLSVDTHFDFLQEMYQILASSVDSRVVRWTAAYEDAFGMGQMVTAAKAIYYQRTASDRRVLIGVVAFDVTLSELQGQDSSYQDVMNSLRQRSAVCDVSPYNECQLQLLRAARPNGYVCPTKRTIADCTSGGTLQQVAQCSGDGNLNDYLCETLQTNTGLNANGAQSTAAASCCSATTCPANLWNGPSRPPPPPTPAPGCQGSKALLIVVIAEASPSLDNGLTETFLNQAIPAYIATQVDASSCTVSWIYINSQGSATTALSQYSAQVSVGRGLTANNATSPILVAVVVLDNTEVTQAIQSAVSPTIPVISAWASDANVADPVIYPSAVRLLPEGSQIATAYLKAANAFKWDSVGILYENTKYGVAMKDAVDHLFREAGARIAAPVVVSTAGIAVDGDTASDEAVLRSLAANNPVGIIAFVSKNRYVSLQAAARRLSQTSSVIDSFFFLLPAECIDVLDVRSVVVTPPYAKPFAGLPDAIPFQANMLQLAALKASTLIDAIRIPIVAMRSTSTGSFVDRVLGVTFNSGMTGAVAFNANLRRRSDLTAIVNFNVLGRDSIVGRWTVATGFTSLRPDIASVVPASPLKAVTVCVLATPGCHDVANVNHLLFLFNQANSNHDFMVTNNVKFITIAMNTGDDSVTGMRLLLRDASRCNFVTGPGRSSVAFALTPIINAFSIPQIDYSATSTAFTDKSKYPFFSRVVPSDSPVSRVYAEVASNFKWDRVALMTTDDEYGRNVAAAVAGQMEEKTIDVEWVYRLKQDFRSSWVAGGGVPINTGSNMFMDSLTHIRDVLITRIVLVLVPTSVESSRQFFRTVEALNMSRTHIFLLGDSLCQVSDTYPELREPLVGSVCLRPFFNTTNFDPIRQQYLSIPQDKRLLFNQQLIDGEFPIDGCNMDYTDMYSAFAYDAGQVILNVVQRALSQGVSLTNGTGLTELIRSTNIPDVLPSPPAPQYINGSLVPAPTQAAGAAQTIALTGNLSFSPNGDRAQSDFIVNIQQRYPTGVVEFARWKSGFPYQRYDASTLPYGEIRWADNTTAVPKSTYRSVTFIAQAVVAQHPGSIILSIFGFLVTIAVFVFCYRHQKTDLSFQPQDSEMGGVAAPAKQTN